ncbi:MAG: carboxymuconolactone decarboxylase family protein [Deltaproteobacteria bacterium]|nr:carboxymuconolactone decarboxylase family protein [Deltaproteobacteria bacterium]
MARLDYPDLDTLDEQTTRRLNALGRPLNIFRMLAWSPGLLAGFQDMGAVVLGGLELDATLREIAILRVARVAGAGYEWAQHVPMGMACGVTQAQVDALEQGEADSDAFSELERDVIAAADELLADARLGDATLEKLRAALGDRQVVELLVAVGFYTMVSRFLESTGVELEAGGVPGPDEQRRVMDRVGEA